MKKQKFQLYLFIGKTTLSTRNLSSLKGLLPSEVDLMRRLFISETTGIPFQPFVLELSQEQGRNFINEIVRKCKRGQPHNTLFLKPTYPIFYEGQCQNNLGVVKIVIKLPKNE